MTLSDDLELIAEHIGDDQPNLPDGAKNSLLLAAKALRKLPHTADGVPVVPGMRVWQKPGLISGKKYPPREVQADVLMSEDGMLGEVEEYRWTYYASDCYSTRQAAEKASNV